MLILLRLLCSSACVMFPDVTGVSVGLQRCLGLAGKDSLESRLLMYNFFFSTVCIQIFHFSLETCICQWMCLKIILHCKFCKDCFQPPEGLWFNDLELSWMPRGCAAEQCYRTNHCFRVQDGGVRTQCWCYTEQHKSHLRLLLHNLTQYRKSCLSWYDRVNLSGKCW